MINGIDGDDAYRLVEDELLAVANTFTVHLHAAEYERLRAAAESQHEETLRNIARPVTGPMTSNVKRKHDALKLALKQQAVLSRKDTDDDDSDDDVKPKLPPALYGLMDVPRQKAVTLTSVAPAASKTRAAAGFQDRSPAKRKSFGLKSSPEPPQIRGSPPRNSAHVDEPETESDDDLDDLDRPSRFSGPFTASAISSNPRPVAPARPKAPETRPTETSTNEVTEDDSDCGLDDMDFLRKDRERREQKRAQERAHKAKIKLESQTDVFSYPWEHATSLSEETANFRKWCGDYPTQTV